MSSPLGFRVCEGCGKGEARFHCGGWQASFCYECCSDFNCPAFPESKRGEALRTVDRDVSDQFDGAGRILNIREIKRRAVNAQLVLMLQLVAYCGYPAILTAFLLGIGAGWPALLLLLVYPTLWPRYRRELKLLIKARGCPKELGKRMKAYWRY